MGTLACRHRGGLGALLDFTSTPFYVDPTLPGDANLDRTVNVQDFAILAANYRKQVTGGWLEEQLQHRRRGQRKGPGPVGGQLPAKLPLVTFRPSMNYTPKRSSAVAD